MRSIPLNLFVLLVLGVGLHAQTNTFPSSGNVGIGKTPGLLLDVGGPIRSTSGSIDVRLQAGAAGAAGIGSFSNDPVLFLVGGVERVRLTTGGFVGIGTSAAYARLHVAGSTIGQTPSGSSASSGQFQAWAGGTGQGQRAAYSFYPTFESTGDNYVRRAADIIGGYNGGAWGNEFLAFHVGKDGASNDGQTLTVERMRIAGNGNVGIGTTTPSHKLAVNGTIRAKEVIVDTGWADYVFAPDYRLAPLSEVEAHIREHKRLPGLPSEATVAQEGVSLGEVQTMLLAKIEELTLHQISQEKLLRAQQEEIRGLQTKLAEFNSASSNANRDPLPGHQQ